MATEDTELEERIKQAASSESISDEELADMERVVTQGGDADVPGELKNEPEQEQVQVRPVGPELTKEEKVEENIRNILQKASLPQKIKYAMFGNSTCRTLLVRDANRMIQEFVLKNPRLQVREVEEFAKNPNLSQFVLRRIAENQTWMKSYSLKCSIVTNPKTPGDLALKWLRFLNISELRQLAKSKNVSHVVSTMAKKKVAETKH